jgi:hypothetical protein
MAQTWQVSLRNIHSLNLTKYAVTLLIETAEL